jgi:hypothetical protein
LPFLQAIAHASPREALLARINRRWIFGLTVAEAVAETGWLPARVQQLAAELKQAGEIASFGSVEGIKDNIEAAHGGVERAQLQPGRKPARKEMGFSPRGDSQILITSRWLQRVREDILAIARHFHDANPLLPGVNKQELRATRWGHAALFDAVVASLLRDKKLEASGELLHLPGRGVVLRDEEAESKSQIEQAFAQAGLQVPALKEVLASLPVDKVRAQKIVTLLLRDRVLVKLSDELVFHRDALDALRQRIVAQKTKTPKLNVGNFKDLFGVTRKYAIPLLEYLDRERVTRRVGDERIIL